LNDRALAAADGRIARITRFRQELADHGLLVPGPVPGVYARGVVFERVVDAMDAAVGRLAGPGVEAVRFAPVMGRSAFEATRYVANFPQLAGTVHCFCGNDDDHARLLECLAEGADWTGSQRASEVVLTPASCYPVYGMVAARGPLPAEGQVIDAASWCFRHEASEDPIRMLSFRQREQVCLGTEAQVDAFEHRWTERAHALFRALMLPADYRPANDPFFGRLGHLMAQGQRSQRLKHEFAVPITDPVSHDACGSLNHHGDHFARAFGVIGADGEIARTACAGFGLERLALALFRHHGFRLTDWPSALHAHLWPEA
jgi:seryl-tRNA synthetase